MKIPYILSINRFTDVPAFYADWFFDHFRRGWMVSATQSFSGKTYLINFSKTVGMVFWSKDPERFLPYLSLLRERFIFYFHYTLNDYEKDGLEQGISNLTKRIDAFYTLSEIVGKGHVIWRYDPIIMSNRLGIEEHLERIYHIGNKLRGYCERLVVSFVQINNYRRVRLRMKGSTYRQATTEEKIELSRNLHSLALSWGIEVMCCAEPVDLSQYGISRSKCIDGQLIEQLIEQGLAQNKSLRYLKLNEDERQDFHKSLRRKDVSQRQWCGCCVSRDIGAYNTCHFHCLYCYASS